MCCCASHRTYSYFTFQGDDLASGVHDGTVGRDWSPDWVGGVRHVHDHNLVLLTHLLSDADELVRLHGQIAEPNVGWVHAQVLQLEILEIFLKTVNNENLYLYQVTLI